MIQIKDIMTKDVITAKRETPIYEAMNLLKKHKISGLPVVNDEMRPVGILSEKDFLQLLMSRNVDVKAKVADYMTKKVVTFQEDDSIVSVCEFFIKSSFRRVPILKDRTLVGIVSRRDIISFILQARDEISGDRFA